MKITVPVSKSNTKPILTLLEEMGYTLPCNCHGRHYCDGSTYSFDCSMIPHGDVTLDLPETAPVRSITLETETVPGPADTLLVDLGTTTIAMALMQSSTGELRQTSLFANPQSQWGSDVMARIHAACHGDLGRLKNSVSRGIREQAMALCTGNRQSPAKIRRCYIGGNTAMIHILMGYDCSPLAASPFTPGPAPAPFHCGDCTVIIPPWMSAFVGGDITAGLRACRMPGEGTAMLIDLGTNGEMALAHRGQCYTTATAAGPAFEGNGLSCGCAGIPGAITSVSLRPLHPVLTTIDNKLPVGLCGSGALSLCAELLRRGFVDSRGILTSLFPEEGVFLGNTPEGRSLRFTPEDFRNVQLAVAAIAAGMETLCHTAGIRPEDIPVLHLGGGFGFHLSPEDCRTLGLFSSFPAERIHIAGNTCLTGLYYYAQEPEKAIESPSSRYLELSSDPYFKKQFIRHMTYSD